MTKTQLEQSYTLWVEKHQLLGYPAELDNAVPLLSFDSGHSETEYSGTQILAIAKQRKGKIHLFVFALRTTWPSDNDFNDRDSAKETYRKIISF